MEETVRDLANWNRLGRMYLIAEDANQLHSQKSELIPSLTVKFDPFSKSGKAFLAPSQNGYRPQRILKRNGFRSKRHQLSSHNLLKQAHSSALF